MAQIKELVALATEENSPLALSSSSWWRNLRVHSRRLYMLLKLKTPIIAVQMPKLVDIEETTSQSCPVKNVKGQTLQLGHDTFFPFRAGLLGPPFATS
jgi:hypothetical protein